MKEAYPIVITPAEEGGYVVFVPDLDINTQGESIAECIEMARDAIGIWGICQQDMGNAIPAPNSKPIETSENDIVTLVDISFDAYRRAQDMRAVRKNVTIPSYLNDLAEAAHINFSQVLQDGLKSRLGVQ